jgi:hypothetical protein
MNRVSAVQGIAQHPLHGAGRAAPNAGNSNALKGLARRSPALPGIPAIPKIGRADHFDGTQFTGAC